VITTSENGPAIVCEESGVIISVSDSSDRLLRGLILYGKTTQNGTPTPTSPAELVSVGGDGSIGVSVAGGNLCNPNAFRISGGDVSKHLFVSDDGWLLFENATEYNNYPMVTIPVPTGDYTVSVEIASITGNTGVYFSKTKSDYSKKHTSGVTGILTDTDQIWIAITGKNGATAKIRITINAGNTALPFELYKSQTLTISTPNGLPGIPVTSGGNYTDEKGQQWICDEVDFARGVYVQRIQQYTFDGSSDEYWNYQSGYNGAFAVEVARGNKPYDTKLICNWSPLKAWSDANKGTHYCFINESNMFTIGGSDITQMCATVSAFRAKLAVQPIHVIYVRNTVKETALSAAEMAAYYALHSNKPNTAVYNDAGAGMKLSYVADTKIYIDNKFNELAAALVNKT